MAATATTERPLWRSEILISDLVGRLIEFWGFKRNMGRVWAILYLSPAPLSAADIQGALRLSAGGVSMTLQELARWGVVKKVWVVGDRRDYFAAEVHLWKMVSRVLSEREGSEISAAIEACEDALRWIERFKSSSDAAERERAELQSRRIDALLKVARLGKQLLDMLLRSSKIDPAVLSGLDLEPESSERQRV
jgi:DNA-binding transcriptional regulator GbsR (MarR family)